MTEEHGANLVRHVSPEEVKEALFVISDQKASGLDGYGSGFFKDTWEIVGNDIIRAVTDFFSSGKLLK